MDLAATRSAVREPGRWCSFSGRTGSWRYGPVRVRLDDREAPAGGYCIGARVAACLAFLPPRSCRTHHDPRSAPPASCGRPGSCRREAYRGIAELALRFALPDLSAVDRDPDRIASPAGIACGRPTRSADSISCLDGVMCIQRTRLPSRLHGRGITTTRDPAFPAPVGPVRCHSGRAQANRAQALRVVDAPDRAWLARAAVPGSARAVTNNSDVFCALPAGQLAEVRFDRRCRLPPIRLGAKRANGCDDLGIDTFEEAGNEVPSHRLQVEDIGASIKIQQFAARSFP